MPRQPARNAPLDDLVLKVTYIDLLECRGPAEFKTGVRLAERNLRQTMSALSGWRSADARLRRAMEQLKFMASRLLELCRHSRRAGSDNWREQARQISVNYERFRIEAGHLYRLAVPGSAFDVLRSAL